MRVNWKTLLIGLLILLLVFSNGFFIIKARTPSIFIQVGIPLDFDDSGDVTSIYYSQIENKENTDIILLAMVNALPLQEEEFPQTHPDATIVVGYNGVGYPYQVWFTEDSVIVGNHGPDLVQFKEFYNDHTGVIPLLKDLVNQLKNTNLVG